MKFFPVIYRRSLTELEPATVTNGLEMVVNHFRKSAIGGPKELSITVYGEANKLFELLEYLRAPVELFDEKDRKLWWGMISRVSVRLDSLEMSVGLDGMANKVAVEYSKVLPGSLVAGERKVTDWALHNVSIATYGTKELVRQLSDAIQETAESLRDQLLEQTKYPISEWSMSGSEASLSATVECVGWWDSLGWLHYQDLGGYVSYEEDGPGVHAVGSQNDEQVAESFSFTGDVWYAETAAVRIRKEGSPADNVVISICSDSSGEPGTVLSSGSFDGSVLSDQSYSWREVTLSPRIQLSASTTYWIKVSRSGALNNTNHYFVNTNEELGYTDGVFKDYDSPNWSSHVPDTDMLFRVVGVRETTLQLNDMISEAGQFFNGITIESDSGIYSVPYRSGDQKADVLIEELLEAGTSNGVRLLADVTDQRWIRIYEEPSQPDPNDLPDYYLHSDTTVTYKQSVIEPHMVPTAVWMEVVGVLPETVDVSKLRKPDMAFIEEFEFSVRGMKGRLYPRTSPSPWSAGGIL